MTAWRWTVSCRSAFSIDTAAWPARYANSSCSVSVKLAPARAIESTPTYSSRRRRRARRSGPASACTPSTDAEVGRRCSTGCSSPAGSRLASSSATSVADAKARARPPSSARTSRSSSPPMCSACMRRASIGTRPAGLGLARLHRCAHRQLDQPWRSRPVANASPTRRIVSSSSRALALDLLDLRRELRDMLLNSRPSAANSSSPWTGTGGREVALREPAGGDEELVDLRLQRAHDEHRQDQRQHQEAEQDDADQEPGSGRSTSDALRVGERPDRHRPPDRLLDLREAAAVARAVDLHLAGLGGPLRAALGERGGQRLVAARTGAPPDSVRPPTDSAKELGSSPTPPASRTACRSLVGRRAPAASAGCRPRLPRACRRVVERDARTGGLPAGAELRLATAGALRRQRAPQRGLARDALELRARLGAILAVDGERDAQALRDARVRLAELALRRDAEQDERHGAHRHDHDDREEQEQAVRNSFVHGPSGRLPTRPAQDSQRGHSFDLPAPRLRYHDVPARNVRHSGL